MAVDKIARKGIKDKIDCIQQSTHDTVTEVEATTEVIENVNRVTTDKLVKS